MANKKKETEKDVNVDEILSRSEKFIEKNKMALIYAVAAIIAIAAIVVGYHYLYSIPKNEQGKLAIFKGEQYFEKDSFMLALNGNGVDFEGFEAMIDQYRFTKIGNLAKAYAGVCYYKLGDPQSAINHLKSYQSSDSQIGPTITGLIGDCYVSTGDTKEGISYFKKAASKANNELISPIYLKKAGIAYESLKQYKDAIKMYTEIKEKYSNSTEAASIDKYITRAEILSSGN